MKILLDENLPHALRRCLPGHDVFTVQYLGWSGAKNGALVKRARDHAFDVVLTMDVGVQYEQNLKTLPIAILIMSAPSNDMVDLLPLLPAVLASLARIRPCEVIRVP